MFVALEAVVGVGAEELVRVGVAARSRDHVDRDAGRLVLGVAAGDRVRHLLERRFVVVDPVEPALAEAVVGVHAVDLELEVGAAAPERHQRARLRGRAAADVEPPHRHAGQRVADGLEVAACRQRVEELASHHLATHRVLHVDDGSLA